MGDGSILKAVVDAHQRLTNEGVDVKKLLGTGLVLGLTFGTAFQPTHNNGYLPVSSCHVHRKTQLLLPSQQRNPVHAAEEACAMG